MSSTVNDKAAAAVQQFNTSSKYQPPKNWSGPLWSIKNDYPRPYTASSTPGDAPGLPLPDVPVGTPWTKVDFKTPDGAKYYAKLVKEHCWEGNRSVDFVIQENTIRPWFHAPWMHASANGREPLKGLTYERSIPPFEFACSQTNALQNWAIGFYNAPGASVFGGVWDNPAEPVWNQDLKFPPGTVVFKLLFTTATEDQVPTMKGAPCWQAVIAKQDDPKVAPSTAAKRADDKARDVRLIQVDWAAVDERSPVGWVFGTFMYNGYLQNIEDPWDRLTPVGVMWGNDPQLDQAAVDRGEKPVESWINPDAETLRKELNGMRPSWGYNGRLNGPADNFISACTSCHGTSQSFEAPLVQPGKLVETKEESTCNKMKKKKWVPLNEKLTMTWFQNVKAGETFSVRGALSADYSLQFIIGWSNYNNWSKTYQEKAKDKTKTTLLALPTRRVVFRPQGDLADDIEAQQKILDSIRVEDVPSRAGPDFSWS